MIISVRVANQTTPYIIAPLRPPAAQKKQPASFMIQAVFVLVITFVQNLIFQILTYAVVTVPSASIVISSSPSGLK